MKESPARPASPHRSQALIKLTVASKSPEGVRSVGAVEPMLLSAHRGSPEARPTDAGRGDVTRYEAPAEPSLSDL